MRQRYEKLSLWAAAIEARIGKTALCVVASIALALIWFTPTIFARPADLDRYFLHAAVGAGYERAGIDFVRALVGAAYRLEHPGWFPLATVPLDVWLTDPRAQTVKLLQYFFIAANFGFFAYACRRLTGSAATTFVAVACTLAAWQLRPVHDPVLGTALVVPWLGIFAFGALGAFGDYVASQNRLSLIVCCAALALAVLVSPVAWGFALALIAIAFFMRKKGAGIAMSAATLPLIVASYALGAPVAPRDSVIYLHSVATQAFAAVPATFRAIGGIPIGTVPDLYHNGTRYIDDRFITIPSIDAWGWFAVLACTGAAFFGLRSLRAGEGSPHLGRSVAVAAALVAAPTLTAPLTASLQDALRLGTALEPVYFAYFGVGLLAALLARAVLTRGANSLFVAALGALVVMLLAYGNVRVDSAIIARTLRVDDPRGLVQRAAGSGLFEHVPNGATIAIPNASWLSDAPHGLSGGAYALYHYTRRRYRVVTYADVTQALHKNTWVLETTRKTGIFVTIAHVVAKRNGTFLVDRAFGYTAIPAVWETRDRHARGIATNILHTRDGAVIQARRTCGPVAFDDAFLPSLPQITWGDGFYNRGPVGYVTAPQPRLWGLGTMVAPYPKLLMSATGSVVLTPSACPPTALNLEAVAVSTRPAQLTVAGEGHTDVLRISQKPHMFWLRFLHPTGPIRLRFETNAPRANLDPIIFRYERDKPRDLRLIVEAGRVWEDVTPPNETAR